jgi:RNA polymerase sigma-70 factor (ECF subfamily)
VATLAFTPDELLADAELAVRARTDEAAFTTLYERHSPYIARVAHRLLGGDADVDDVVQETFLDAANAIGDLVDPGAIRAWLVAIAVRRVHKVLAKRKRRTLFSIFAAELAPRASDPRDRQPVDDLYDALDRIPDELRIPWVLARVQELTLPETARACRVSLATVKRRIAEAEERLRRRLGP